MSVAHRLLTQRHGRGIPRGLLGTRCLKRPTSLSANMDQGSTARNCWKEASVSEENETLLCRYMDEVWHKRNLGASEELMSPDSLDHAE